ncbi:bifunctional D-altronate/D-mannonate dehydratase [Parenemella sanctibonifatiensis]|uniref:Bifunctional D-altronate/D-mannonate dehydratase n=1 Tax=Parenemella sanctibonifatiensis TaxID=2016505 RepID=A0A255EEB1_9ACTN|nr:bifunctional D-altronate/D-mannonate dehydratase [Parenemella sanctibonifatiensis]
MPLKRRPAVPQTKEKSVTDTIQSAEVLVASPSRNYVTLRITTADGIVGLGDATVNGRELAVASYLRDHIAPLLIGSDPSRIEDTWQYLYRGAYWRRGPVTMAAIGAIDMALWDIQGKRAGLPVHQLLGGRVRDKIPAYQHAFGWDVPALMDAIDAQLDQGATHIRVQSGIPGMDKVYGVSKNPSYEPAGRGARPSEEVFNSAAYLHHAPQILAAAREKVGPLVHLLHDVHHRLTPTEAARLAREVEPLHLFWLEDITPAEDPEALRVVRDASITPLAIGEVFNTIWDCQRLIEDRLIDYIRVAVNHAGGISHVRKIYSLAELHGVKAGPHGPSDISPVAMAASIQLATATHNWGVQEYMGYPEIVHEAFPHDWRFEQGHLYAGDAPGLGVDLDESVLNAHPYETAYLPTARDVTGAVLDW